MEERSLYKVLSDIQKNLVVPKNQFNKFGKYNYRSCEDILEKVKPLLGDGVCLLMEDNIEIVGNRFYVVSKVTLTNGKESISTCARAREDENKKGMDLSQLTGACSSYARKYALAGLFLLDDNKDHDSPENHQNNRPNNPPPNRPNNPSQGNNKTYSGQGSGALYFLNRVLDACCIHDNINPEDKAQVLQYRLRQLSVKNFKTEVLDAPVEKINAMINNIMQKNPKAMLEAGYKGPVSFKQK